MDADFIRIARELFYSVRRYGQDQHPLYSAPPGWEYKGCGNFSRVYQHLEYKHLVVKISGPSHWGSGGPQEVGELGVCESNGEPRLDAWPVFAEYCKNNYHTNEHLPRVYHFERVSRGFSWGILETLDPVPYNARVFHTQRVEWQDQLRGGKPAQSWLLPILSMRSGLNLWVDLHAENVMLRGDTLIMNDPFSSAHSGTNAS